MSHSLMFSLETMLPWRQTCSQSEGLAMRYYHERDILNHAHPTSSVDFFMKRLLYYIEFIHSRKNKPCPLFSSFNILYLSEVRHNTKVKTVANFWFTLTLLRNKGSLILTVKTMLFYFTFDYSTSIVGC